MEPWRQAGLLWNLCRIASGDLRGGTKQFRKRGGETARDGDGWVTDWLSIVTWYTSNTGWNFRDEEEKRLERTQIPTKRCASMRNASEWRKKRKKKRCLNETGMTPNEKACNAPTLRKTKCGIDQEVLIPCNSSAGIFASVASYRIRAMS